MKNTYKNTAPTDRLYVECSNCGRQDHEGYRCPCGCHDERRGATTDAIGNDGPTLN